MTDTSLDQPARVTKAAIRQAESRVAETLDLVWKDNDPNVAARFLQQGDAVEQLTALMRAEFLYGLSKDWVRRGMHGEFVAWAIHRTGKDKIYVERRVRVGAMLADADLPSLYRDKLKMRSIEELIIVSSAWDGGDLRPTKPQWDKLLEQPDPASLGDEIRRLLGRKEKVNARTIFWCADGTLEAWQDGTCEHIGFLKRPAEGDKGIGAWAVARLTKGKVKDK